MHVCHAMPIVRTQFSHEFRCVHAYTVATHRPGTFALLLCSASSAKGTTVNPPSLRSAPPSRSSMSTRVTNTVCQPAVRKLVFSRCTLPQTAPKSSAVRRRNRDTCDMTALSTAGLAVALGYYGARILRVLVVPLPRGHYTLVLVVQPDQSTRLRSQLSETGWLFHKPRGGLNH
jgi:hypothetical protein